jgi:hypothetical protein
MFYQSRGEIFSGQGDASKNYPKLFDLLAPYVPELKSYHPASINIAVHRLWKDAKLTFGSQQDDGRVR